MSYNNLPLLRKMSNNNSNWKTNAILGKMEKHRNDTKLLLISPNSYLLINSNERLKI